MRQFALLQRKVTTLPSVAKPLDDLVVRDRINRSMRRRMSDDLVTLIRRACLCGHAETAKGLWVVLRDLTFREAKQHYPHGRVPEKSLLETLAVEIAAAVREKSSKP